MNPKKDEWKRKESVFFCFALLSFVLAITVIVFHLGFYQLPLLFVGLGIATYFLWAEKSLYLFFFFLPLINSTPDLFFNGYPYNYMGVPLFYLSGLLLASVLRREKLKFDFYWADAYLWFLILLYVSAFFVFLRWSNLTVSLSAFLKDTPVTVAGDRLSFSVIFPVITLFIFSLSPFVAALIRKNHLPESRVMGYLLSGFGFSVAIGFVQKFVNPDFMAQKWWGILPHQFNAGFSDFNAFGFFSGALCLYLITTSGERNLTAGPKWKAAISFWGLVLIALAGIFLSGSRTAFIFVLFAFGFLLWSPKVKSRTKVIAISLMLVLLAVSGGTLKERIVENLKSVQNMIRSSSVRSELDRISNGRMQMMVDGIPILKKYPLSGVGCGNFLFFLKYSNFRQGYYEDLPLNHYLLVFAENGIPGLLLFLVFLAMVVRDQRMTRRSIVFAAMLFALFFNQFFWFPEVVILFWMLSAFGGSQAEYPPPFGRMLTRISVALMLACVIGNVLQFRSLHPLTWAEEKKTGYDYGFWYGETSCQGMFRWTKARAATLVGLDRNGRSGSFFLSCGAPLAKMKEGKQRLTVFWKGKRQQTMIFSTNEEKAFSFHGKPFDRGFLEFRVTPIFNLKRMGLGEETRDLGIKVRIPAQDLGSARPDRDFRGNVFPAVEGSSSGRNRSRRET